jgi:hypothetical protein
LRMSATVATGADVVMVNPRFFELGRQAAYKHCRQPSIFVQIEHHMGLWSPDSKSTTQKGQGFASACMTHTKGSATGTNSGVVVASLSKKRNLYELF